MAFIKHNGGGRPHSPLIHVEVKFRDGRVERGGSAFLCWPWADEGDDSDDILEWREVPPPPTQAEIIAELLENAVAARDTMARAGDIFESMGKRDEAERLRRGADVCRALISKATGAA